MLLALSLLALPIQEPAPIRDNSFLIEEAYNQEPGVVQHVSTFQHEDGGTWAYGFTQEWPLLGQRHQLSGSLSLLRLSAPGGRRTGPGDAGLTYRYQIAGLDGGALAVAPRVTVVIPTGRESTGHGAGEFGLQVNLPVSLALGRHWAMHANAGLTGGGGTVGTAGGSLIWLPLSWLNLLTESLWTTDDEAWLNPGVRLALNLPGGVQVVPGVAWTVGIGPSSGRENLFLYLSVEHSFRRVPPGR